MNIEQVIAGTMDEFAKTFEGVEIDYSALMKKADEAGGGVEITTVPKFIQRAVMMAYQAGQDSKDN